MAAAGSVIRTVLNINFIWGAMILVSFALCVGQHYSATATIIPADRLAPGVNTVTIHTRAVGDEQAPDGGLAEHVFTLGLTDGGLAIDPNDRQPSEERPWLISAARADGGFTLQWEAPTHGPYTVTVNDEAVEVGRLVKLQSLTDAAFDYAESGFTIALGLVSSMVLFLGLMKVGEDAGIVQLVARVFYPVIRFLFPQVPKDHPANGAILMNWTTTVLGLGNAATPFGLKAMKELQSLNDHPRIATDSQVMLLGFNTAGFALLPTTLIAMRKAAGTSDPFEIIGTCMLAGAVSTVTAIIVVKVLGRLPMFSWEAAVAEDEAEREKAGGKPTEEGA